MDQLEDEIEGKKSAVLSAKVSEKLKKIQDTRSNEPNNLNLNKGWNNLIDQNL